MSRHLLLDRPDRQIFLGFDHPLRSFFGQEFRSNGSGGMWAVRGGWPTRSGLGMRAPVATDREAARDLDWLCAWASGRLVGDGSLSEDARNHLQRLREILRFEWDDGDDAAEIPLPDCLKGPRA